MSAELERMTYPGNLPSRFGRRLPRALSAALGALMFGACGSEQAPPSPASSGPKECVPEPTTLRNLDDFLLCCPSEFEPLRSQRGGLPTCAPSSMNGAGGAGGALLSPEGAAGALPTTPSPWLVISHPFRQAWSDSKTVCLHMTSTGDAVSGELAVFTRSSSDECTIADPTPSRAFVATEGATAYVCVTPRGGALTSPGPTGELAIAFRFAEGRADALRVDAVDVNVTRCEP